MSETTVQEILDLEERLRQAEMRVDLAALDAFFAEEVMVTAPIGIVVDKAACTSEFERAASLKVEAYDKEDINVRVFGDTAVTSYRVHAKAEHEGTSIDHRFRITNVWLKREGRWQVVARHTAMLEQPKAEQHSA
ncbi:MAG TPA: nuclear transport factor 2 family protein [Blastocatellia bacterium]|nr:nuclear transport factor 2 family protein [Blastocatellia bacterium]